MKNNRGFTLIELMIAIAIIGILALVLIPRVGGMKAQAKLAGVDTNLRVAAGIIEGIITNYDADVTGCAALETEIASRLDVSTPASDKDIKNPITQTAGVVKYVKATPAPANGAAAFTYDEGDGIVAIADPATTLNASDMKGVIYYQAFVENNTLKVDLYPFDDNGKYMKSKIKTIEK